MDGPRACRESDFDEVISLINRVFRAGTAQDISTDYPLVFEPSKLEYMRILRVDGTVVAHVPVAPRRVVAADDDFMIGIISPTVTHPDYRRRGYATVCLQDCIRIMEEQSMVVSALWTEEATFPFYHHSGFEAVGSQGWVYRLSARDRALFQTGAFDVIPYDPNSSHHLDSIVGTHDAEPYRIARSRSDYRSLFTLPKTSTYLARKGEEIAAYLTVGEGVNKPGLIEGGGDIQGLEALTGHALTEHAQGREIQAIVPLTPSGMGQLLEAKMPRSGLPVEEAAGVGPQMVRVNSLQKLLRQTEGYLRTKSAGVKGEVCLVCDDTREAVTLDFEDGNVGITARRSDEPVVLTRRQLAQLIFGHYPTAAPLEIGGVASDILGAVFPYYLPIWELDHS